VLLYVVFHLPFLKAVPAGFPIALDLGQLDCVIEHTKEKMDRNLYLESDSKRYRLPEETERLIRLSFIDINEYSICILGCTARLCLRRQLEDCTHSVVIHT